MRAAAPVHEAQREAFLAAVAAKLASEPAVGIGLVHRTAAELQTRYLIEARIEASIGATPRHSQRQNRSRARVEIDA
jgi:hypothetical protein